MAIQAIEDKGQIQVSVRQETTQPAWVTIEVADSGCGMEPEQLRRIFEPFYTTRDEGTGLGAGDYPPNR